MTPLGKEFRKWRIDHDMLLGDMADKLGVSASYLSQIEKGNKPIPPGFTDRAVRLLKVDAATKAAWIRAEILSTQEFTIKGPDLRDRETVHQLVEFARLTPEKKDAIRRALGK